MGTELRGCGEGYFGRLKFLPGVLGLLKIRK